MARVIVIGAGVMGLSAAYHALKAGHSVDLFEIDTVPGGMAAHFDFDGISIERFYHFVCKADQPTFDLMKELGIGGLMRWRRTSMGYFIDGKHYPWGDPFSLLRFPKLDLISKIRYGLMAFISTKRSNWKRLDSIPADRWLLAWLGQRGYDLLWRRLFELKFFEYSHNVSAAWIWTRIKRVGTSRRSLFQEELGYIEGGSETLVRALADKITAMGGRIHLRATVEEVTADVSTVTGVRVAGRHYAADHVISTVPTPYVSRLVPALSKELREQYDGIVNIGVICVVAKLRKSVTQNFWLNVVDAQMDIPGIIEFSNLRPLPATVVYVPYYMPHTHPKWEKDNAYFQEEVKSYLRKINPALNDEDFLSIKVARLRHAQPLCPPEFLKSLPPVVTPICGLQVADTCFYYPEDRGISESVRFAKEMVTRLGKGAGA